MRFNKIIVGIMIIGIVAAAYLAMGRFMAESRYKNYEVTMDLEEIKKIAATENKSLEQSLADWKEVGIDSVTITEASLDTLRFYNDFKLRFHLEGYDLVVNATEQGIDFVEKGLTEVLQENRKIIRRSPTELLVEGIASDFAFKFEVSRDFLEKRTAVSKVGEISKLQFVGLGYVPAEMEAVQKSGLAIQFRPTYMSGVQDAKKSVDRFIQAVKEYSHQSYAIFHGETILAMDTDPDYLIQAMKENEIAAAMIETSVQREHLDQVGLKPLVEKLDYKAIRVFSTWNYIQKRYDYGMPMHHHGQEIISTFYRAITERNVRVIFFKPFITSGSELISDYPVYKARFADLERRLAEHGILRMNRGENEKIQTMPYVRIRPAIQMLAALAVIACLLILVDNFIKVKPMILYGLFVLAALPTVALYLLQIRVAMLNMMYGLAATVLFAVLAVQFIFAACKEMFDRSLPVTKTKAFLSGIWYLLVSVGIAFTGAICETAFYAESKYLLELAIFKGVKISQLLPLILAILVAIRYFGNDILGQEEMTTKERAVRLLNRNVKFWHAMVAVVLLAGVGLLLIRSGHETGVQPANLELFIRNILEEILPARPRNKAFLVGFPAVILMVYWAYQRKFKLTYPVLALMAGVGYANLLNTFSHIRTPLYLSILRTGYEVIFAVAMAMIYVVVFELAEKIIRKCRA